MDPAIMLRHRRDHGRRRPRRSYLDARSQDLDRQLAELEAVEVLEY